MQQVCVSILFTRFAKGNSMALKFLNEAALTQCRGLTIIPFLKMFSVELGMIYTFL